MAYEASGKIHTGGTVSLVSSQWKYLAHFGQSGKSRFVTGGSANIKSSKWHYVASGNINSGNSAIVRSTHWSYFAHFGGLGQSALRITGGTAGALTSYHTYIAQFGGLGQSALRITESTVAVRGSYYPYLAQFGNQGQSALRVSGGTATIVAPRWSYSASGGLRAGSTVSVIIYRGNYLSLLNQPRLGLSAISSLVITPAITTAGMKLAGTADAGKFLLPIVASGEIKAAGAVNITLGTLVMSSGGHIKTGNAAQVVRNASTVTGGGKFGGTAHAACSYFAFNAVPSSLGLYAPSYYELIHHQQPLGFWVLSDAPGTTLTNYGIAPTGTAQLNGSPVFQQFSWIPNQKDGYSMRFDWINTYAEVVGDFTDEVSTRSISLIVRLYDVTARSCIYDEGNTISGFNLSVVGGNLIFHVWDLDPPLFDSVSIITPISVNQTYHVVATLDASNNMMQLWVNGVLVGSESVYAVQKNSIPVRDSLAFGAKLDGTRYNDTNGGFVASSSSPGTGHWVRGHLQAVAIWNRVLSTIEITLQQQTRAARYFSSVDNFYNYNASGNVHAGGSVDTQSSHWMFQPSGKITAGGTSAATMPVVFVVLGSGNAQLGGNALTQYNRFEYPSTGGLQFALPTQILDFDLTISATGKAVFGNNAVVTASHHSYVASGGGVLAVFSNLGSLVFSRVATGNMVLTGTANRDFTFTYAASGVMQLEPFGEFDYTLEVERDITWNISRGILKYYRVEGKPKPNICNPTSGVCGPEQCVQFIVNVSAHSVAEVCDQLRKLRFKGPVKRISVMSRPVLKADEDPDVNYDCIEFVDVEIPTCDDLFLEYDLLVTAGVTSYTIFTQDFAHISSGCMKLSGESNGIFNKWEYVAGGKVFFGNAVEATFPGLVIIAASGKASFAGSATYSTNALGTLVTTAGATPIILFAEVIFGSQTGGTLSLPDETVETVCCGDLPSLLYLNHQMERFAKLDKFLFINTLSIRNNLRLVYSAKKNIWYNNLHFKGTGISNDTETWDITSEFGCVDDLDGIPIQGTLWGFSFAICNRNLRTRADNYTRIVLGFDPNLICTLDEAIDNIFMVNVRDQSTDPVVLRAVVLYDEIGLFKNRAFINDPNIKFRVTSTPLTSSLNNINLTNSLQEILL